jgi:metal-responsive CopG/Arc/MetJ family transcriptional regulator
LLVKGTLVATTVNISFQDNLLADIDRLARKERRSRSELLREAARLYIERRSRWDKIFSLGQAVAARSGLSEEDVAAEIQAYRKSKAARQ